MKVVNDLYKRRKKLKMSREKLAAITGLSVSTIQRIEMNDPRVGDYNVERVRDALREVTMSTASGIGPPVSSDDLFSAELLLRLLRQAMAAELTPAGYLEKLLINAASSARPAGGDDIERIETSVEYQYRGASASGSPPKMQPAGSRRRQG